MGRALWACVLLGAGCASLPVGPPAADQESALVLAWEGWLAMERASRPAITWWADERCDRYAVNDAVVNIPGTCLRSLTVDHTVSLWWIGRISETDFAYALGQYSGYLTTGEWTRRDPDEVNAQLAAAGL